MFSEQNRHRPRHSAKNGQIRRVLRPDNKIVINVQIRAQTAGKREIMTVWKPKEKENSDADHRRQPDI